MSSQTESVQLKDNTDLQIQRIIEKHEKRMETQGLEEPRKRHRLSCMEEESQRERSRVQLVKQIAAILKQGDMRYTKDGLHRTFQDDDLLERIFRLFCDEEHLVQEDWIESLKERLQEDKQLDFVEQVESVAYVLCGDGVVTKETFSKIWKNKVVTNKLFRAVEGGSGWVSAADLVDLITAATDNRTRAGIDKESLDRLERLFKETVGDQREITREQFQKIVVSKNPFFTERVFQIFDADDSGSISLREFLSAAARVASRSPRDKLRFLFQVYDLDGDGLIQHRELQHVMRAAMEENNMSFSEEQLRDLTSALFEDADVEGRGAITCDALRDQLDRHGGLLDNLSISIDRWLVPPPHPEPLPLRQRLANMRPYQLSLNYLRNNYVFVSYLAFFFLMNVALFIARIVEYWDHNIFVKFARASGQCLNFTSSWVLVLMLRRSLTSLRGVLGALLDRHVSLHKLAALTLIAHAVLHSVMHFCNFALVVVPPSPLPLHVWLLTSRPGVFGLVQGWANPTGVVLVVVLAALAYSSRPAVRRRGCFEVFYFTHLLYVPFWILLILHAPNFWKWFIVPGTVYLIEKMLRLWWLRSGRGRSYITSGALLPSRVLHVAARRPRGFNFCAGDYVFVNVPAIARFEWHPFTISSAPEEKDYIWLHIRSVGEWTNRLYEHFEQQTKREQIQELHFNHSGVVSRQHMWMLSNVPQLDKFKYVIKDSEQLDLVEEVIEEFKYAVIPQMEELEKGVIHGDINEMNVLVALKEGSKSDYRISGILDFGDIQHSCVLFELSVCMTYAMLVSGPRAGGVVLAGWSVTRRLTDQEYRLLKTLVSARLVQSLVLGAYTREQEPENKYVSSTEKANGWELLKKIRKNKPDPEDDCTNWKDIANDFLTRS